MTLSVHSYSIFALDAYNRDYSSTASGTKGGDGLDDQVAALKTITENDSPFAEYGLIGRMAISLHGYFLTPCPAFGAGQRSPLHSHCGSSFSIASRRMMSCR